MTKEKKQRTLHLVLKRKWWDMIESGEKPEEYRSFTRHWFSRLVDCARIKDADLATRYFGYDGKTPNLDQVRDDFDGEWLTFRNYDAVCFHRGYTNVTMLYEFKGTSIGYGNPAWGAPTDKEVFIIKLGKRI